LHGLSYQQARNNTSRVGQVYVAEPGYMLSRGSVPKGAIITQLAGKAIPDMGAFAAVLGTLHHGQRVPLQYYLFSERHRQKTAILHIDHRWCALRCANAENDAASLMTTEDFAKTSPCAVLLARAWECMLLRHGHGRLFPGCHTRATIERQGLVQVWRGTALDKG
jgi:hypothetical protein